MAVPSVWVPRVSCSCPASPETLPRSATGADRSSFSKCCFCQGPGACEILCGPFKCGVWSSHHPLVLPKVSPTGFQSQTFLGIIFLVQGPGLGSPV